MTLTCSTAFRTTVLYDQVLSEVFSERDMPPAKVAEMFSEADWDHSGRVRPYQPFRFLTATSESGQDENL